MFEYLILRHPLSEVSSAYARTGGLFSLLSVLFMVTFIAL